MLWGEKVLSAMHALGMWLVYGAVVVGIILGDLKNKKGLTSAVLGSWIHLSSSKNSKKKH
jgi:hypothetical protein